MDRFRNETIRAKIGMKKGILQETEEQQLRWFGPCHANGGLQMSRHVAEWNPQGKGGAAGQAIHGRMGSGTACKGETRMKNVSIVISGAKTIVFGLR
jgi:hypothetical protein